VMGVRSAEWGLRSEQGWEDAPARAVPWRTIRAHRTCAVQRHRLGDLGWVFLADFLGAGVTSGNRVYLAHNWPGQEMAVMDGFRGPVRINKDLQH